MSAIDITDQQILHVIAVAAAVTDTEVRLAGHLEDDLNMDETDRAGLVEDLEDQFGIAISDREGRRLRTVQQVVDLVRDKTE